MCRGQDRQIEIPEYSSIFFFLTLMLYYNNYIIVYYINQLKSLPVWFEPMIFYFQMATLQLS